MLFLFGWLVLARYLLNEENTFWGNVVFWGGLLLIICFSVSGKKEWTKDQKQEETREQCNVVNTCFFDVFIAKMQI